METSNPAKNCILTKETARRKLRRMAFEIAENNSDCVSIIVAGISGNGVTVAKNLIRELKDILPCTTESITININKRNPLQVSVEEKDFQGKTIIIVDDVANTGQTLLYALKPFLNGLPKKIQSLVLVERSHKLFPVQADYVGLSVSTTLQEHIDVEVEDDEIKGAWLS